MIKNERSEKILELLDTNTYMSVKRLGELLYVSQPTVRRDLAELEAQGLIVRSHGGAKKLSEGDYIVPYDFRTTYKTAEKRELCRRASELISDGDTVYIDESTSALYVAEFITAKNVTAVTNGILTAQLLTKHGVKTYFAGGEIYENSQCCFGVITEEFVSRFNFDLFFFSAHGVNSEKMIVETDFLSASLRMRVFNNSKKSVFIYDSTKTDLTAPHNLMPLDRVDYVFTNS